MTTEEKKEIMRSYRHRKIATRQILGKLRELEAEALPRAIAYDGMPKGGEPKDMSGWAARCDALERKLKKAYEAEIEALDRVETAIEGLEDPLHRAVLRGHYIEFKRIEGIAHELGYSESTVWKMHRRALKAIKL